MDAAQEPEFISMAVVMSELDISKSSAKKYERIGLIPTGRRISGSNARIWPATELPAMRRAVAERRAMLNQRTAKAAAGVAA
jgi:hypothetical protein